MTALADNIRSLHAPTTAVKNKMARTLVATIFLILLISSLSCQQFAPDTPVIAPSTPVLEISNQSYGMTSYKGVFLMIRLDSSGSLELDCLKDYAVPVTESNIFRVKAAPPLDELDKIQQLIDVTIVDAKSQYFNRHVLIVDSSRTTTVVLKGTDARERNIDIEGGYSVEMEKEPELPNSLHELFETVSSVYLRVCRQNR